MFSIIFSQRLKSTIFTLIRIDSVRIYGIQSKIARQRLGHFAGISDKRPPAEPWGDIKGWPLEGSGATSVEGVNF